MACLCALGGSACLNPLRWGVGFCSGGRNALCANGSLTAGMERISGLFDKAVANRVLSDESASQKLASIQRTTSWQGFEEVDLVVEAVVEELPIKQTVFRELERRIPPTAILATNTS